MDSTSSKEERPRSKPRLVKPRRSCLSCGPLVLDMRAFTVTKGTQVIKLTPKETQLLMAFMSHPREILSRELLIKEIWQTDFTDDMRMLHVHIRMLRKKIEDDPSNPKLVQTVRGRGYRFVPPDDEKPL